MMKTLAGMTTIATCGRRFTTRKSARSPVTCPLKPFSHVRNVKSLPKTRVTNTSAGFGTRRDATPRKAATRRSPRRGNGLCTSSRGKRPRHHRRRKPHHHQPRKKKKRKRKMKKKLQECASLGATSTKSTSG